MHACSSIPPLPPADHGKRCASAPVPLSGAAKWCDSHARVAEALGFRFGLDRCQLRFGNCAFDAASSLGWFGFPEPGIRFLGVLDIRFGAGIGFTPVGFKFGFRALGRHTFGNTALASGLRFRPSACTAGLCFEVAPQCCNLRFVALSWAGSSIPRPRCTICFRCFRRK